MLRTAVRRLVLAVPILLGVSVIIFLLMNVLPGDPAAAFLSDDATEAARQAIRHQLGLDQPLPVRYFKWLGSALSGDLGYSPYRRREVTDLLQQAWGNTFILAAVSAGFGLLAGVVVGFVAGIKRGRPVDRVASFVSLSGLSVPSFFLAIVLLTVFAGRLKWFPSGGTDMSSLGGATSHLVLPVLSASLVTMAITARVTRAAIVDISGADFVETLQAKGLSRAQTLRHIGKNALSPVLTTSGLQIGALLGGSVLVETIFRWPGMGLLVYNAISSRDLLVVQGATLVIALTFVIVNLIVDLVQAAIDPRMRGTAS
jgi:peptide/nickel transport system permease protein